MTPPVNRGESPEEPVTFTDKRRIDPLTGEVRDRISGPAPGEPGSDVLPGESPEEWDKAAELLGDLQRVQADFANYRKRALREQQVAAERAKAVVVGQLLTVLDDLDRARSHGDLDSGPLKSVADKLTAALAGLGLSSFGDEGENFDPSVHEAVQHEGDGSNPVVGTVMRRGYRLGEQLLRHALVGVVDAISGDTPEDAGESGLQNAESDS